jgi:RES domain-containing protein
MARKKNTAREKTVKAQARTGNKIPSSDVASKEAGEPPDMDTSDMDALSICSECAKHPTLKKFVLDHGATGNECGICHRRDQIASAPAYHGELSSLIRALVRFSYDEWTYNGHFGGDKEPESLLCEENEIVEHASAPGFPRSAESSEPFLVGLFDNPYPAYDKGIAVYAGHHHEYGQLPPLSALSTSRSLLYERMEHRLAAENYFVVQDEFEEYLAKLGTGIDASLPAGTTLFRARIGLARRFMRGFGGWTANTMFQPFLGAAIGAPPPAKAAPGRLNRDGVSFLYLATDEMTAAAEVRPHPGHRVSIGAFRSLRDIRLADFGVIDIAVFSSSDARLDIFHLGLTISREISLPITPEDRHKYTVTQLLADIIRRQGYDGIRFPSSVAAGSNVCIFQPALFSSEPQSGKVLYVKGLKYRMQKLSHLIEPTDDDIALP